MGYVREKDFERPDKDNPDYSDLEYDLFSRLQMSIRKNITKNTFEIYHRPTGKVIWDGTLKEIVKKANQLEEGENTFIKDK